VGLAVTLDPRALALVATPHSRALDMGLATKSCH